MSTAGADNSSAADFTIEDLTLARKKEKILGDWFGRNISVISQSLFAPTAREELLRISTCISVKPLSLSRGATLPLLRGTPPAASNRAYLLVSPHGKDGVSPPLNSGGELRLVQPYPGQIQQEQKLRRIDDPHQSVDQRCFHENNQSQENGY